VAGFLIYSTLKPTVVSDLSPASKETSAPPPGSPPNVGINIGDRAPDFSASLLRATRGEFRLSDLRGNAVMMNFWASWCGPCRAEARDLEAAYQGYKARGVVFLGVDIFQDTWEDAVAFVKEFGITYPMVRDTTGKITTTYGVANIPTTYFLDREGIIRGRYLGGFLGDPGKQALKQRLEDLVK